MDDLINKVELRYKKKNGFVIHLYFINNHL